MERRTRQRQEPTPTSASEDDYIPQSRAYYDDSITSRITKQAADARSFVNQGHATGKRALGKTQSLPANLLSISLDNSSQNTYRTAQDTIAAEALLRSERELQPYAGVAAPPRADGHDPSNPFNSAPLRSNVFEGDMDWDNDFEAPIPSASGSGFAPNLAASPTKPAPKKRTHERSEAESQEAMDQVSELQQSMTVDQTRQIRQPRKLRPTASLPAENFGSSMGFY